MTNTDTDIIATGGFNTGRTYTAEGQRIFWAQRADGWVYFNDADRMISGWTHRDVTPVELGAPVLAGWLMRRYDLNNYSYKPEGGHPERIEIPANFDYGTALCI